MRQYADACGGGPAVGEALGTAEAETDGVGVALCLGCTVIPLFAAAASASEE